LTEEEIIKPRFGARLYGIGIVYSKNNSPKRLALRGLSLIALHYVLNFFSFGIPNLMNYAMTKDAMFLGEFIVYVFGIDILAFAGLTFLKYEPPAEA